MKTTIKLIYHNLKYIDHDKVICQELFGYVRSIHTTMHAIHLTDASNTVSISQTHGIICYLSSYCKCGNIMRIVKCTCIKSVLLILKE